jgi:hypothetical protein
MDKKEIIKYLAIAGGAYAVYWYITSYGPTGARAEGHPSYLDTWFGTNASNTQLINQQAPTTLPSGYPNQPALNTAPGTQPVLTQPSAPPTALPPVDTSAVKQQILAATAGQIQGGYAIADVWSYFWQQVTGRTITPTQFGTAFPGLSDTNRGAPMNLDQFLSKLSGAGISWIVSLGAIVPSPSIPSIPSMSFGGSLRRPNLQGLRPMRVPGRETVN